MSILRILASPIVGLIALVITVMVVEAISHSLFMPAEQQTEFARLGTAMMAGGDGAAAAREELRTLMDTLPLGAIWGVVAAWTLGVLVGGGVAALVAPGRGRLVALAIGVVNAVLVALNLVLIPHPTGVAVAGLILPFAAAWWVGGCVDRWRAGKSGSCGRDGGCGCAAQQG